MLRTQLAAVTLATQSLARKIAARANNINVVLLVPPMQQTTEFRFRIRGGANRVQRE
jgi:hypothetical protein